MSFSPPQNPFSVYFLHELREMHAAFGNLPSGRPSKLPMPAEMGAPVFLSLFFALPSSKLLFFHIRKKRAVNICQTQPPQNVTGRMTHHFIFDFCVFVGDALVREEGSRRSLAFRGRGEKKNGKLLTSWHRTVSAAWPHSTDANVKQRKLPHERHKYLPDAAGERDKQDTRAAGPKHAGRQRQAGDLSTVS